LAENDPETLKNTGVPVFGESDRVLGLLEKPDNPSPGWFCSIFCNRPHGRCWRTFWMPSVRSMHRVTSSITCAIERR
jgi:hypothetical protein